MHCAQVYVILEAAGKRERWLTHYCNRQNRPDLGKITLIYCQLKIDNYYIASVTDLASGRQNSLSPCTCQLTPISIAHDSCIFMKIKLTQSRGAPQ